MTLRELRLKAGLTQEELAEKAGMSEAYISLLECGLKTAGKIVTLQRLAGALGCTLADLLADVPPPPPRRPVVHRRRGPRQPRISEQK